jgi:hypothetical protein
MEWSVSAKDPSGACKPTHNDIGATRRQYQWDATNDARCVVIVVFLASIATINAVFHEAAIWTGFNRCGFKNGRSSTKMKESWICYSCGVGELDFPFPATKFWKLDTLQFIYM